MNRLKQSKSLLGIFIGIPLMLSALDIDQKNEDTRRTDNQIEQKQWEDHQRRVLREKYKADARTEEWLREKDQIEARQQEQKRVDDRIQQRRLDDRRR